MRWSLVCMPPNVTGKVIHAAVSELNQINIIILYYAAILHQTVQVKTVWFSQFYLKFAFFPPFFPCCFAVSLKIPGWTLMINCVNDSGWVHWARGRRRENDQHWFILAVLLSGWCLQNTSLHPIPSHYLSAITAVQRVSCGVINTSPRPHAASTSSSRRRLMTAKDRQCILSLPCFSLFIHILHWLKNIYLHHDRTAAACPSDFAFKMVH